MTAGRAAGRVWPYEYQDSLGDVLKVFPVAVQDADAAVVQVNGQRAVDVPAGELPALVAALYAAAGQPGPVILDRPEGIDAAIGRPGGTFSAGSYGFATHDGRIDVSGPVQCLLADEAEFIAAALAVFAAALRRDEPDPAEVAELAEVIVTTDPRSRGYSPDPEVIARAALRWMKGRQP